MSAVDSSAAPSKPAAGGRCPRCNNGVLFRIAETATGVLLRCFNCDTQGTIAHEGDYQHVLPGDEGGGATGFGLTAGQLAAKQEAGIDPTAPEPWPSAPAAAPDTEHEPAPTHDVVPAGDEAQQ